MPSEFAPPGGKPRVTKKQIQEMQENYKKAESLAKDTADIEAAEKANIDDIFAKEFEEVFTIDQQIGVYVGRFQPFHNGHENIVKQMLEQNDKVLIFIGTGGEEEINPFSYQQCESFFSEYASGDCIIQELSDTSGDREWVENLANMVQAHTIANSKIHIYAGDLENDYAIKAMKQYMGDFLSIDIDYKEIPRENFTIDVGGKAITISATICRMAIEHNDWDFLRKVLPENVYNIVNSKYT